MKRASDKLLSVGLFIFLVMWILDATTKFYLLSSDIESIVVSLFVLLAASLGTIIHNIWVMRKQNDKVNALLTKHIMVAVALSVYLIVYALDVERTLNPQGPSKGLMTLSLFIIIVGSLSVIVPKAWAKKSS